MAKKISLSVGNGFRLNGHRYVLESKEASTSMWTLAKTRVGNGRDKSGVELVHMSESHILEIAPSGSFGHKHQEREGRKNQTSSGKIHYVRQYGWGTTAFAGAGGRS